MPEPPIEEHARYMTSIYRSAGDLLREGYEAGKAVPFPAHERLGFCGMGTSGFAGEISGLTLEAHGARYCSVTRSWRPPSWVTERDLLVAVSYSGNTAETIDCLASARGRARLAAVTSGGLLGRKARELAIPLVLIRGGMPQRTTLPLMVGAILGAFSGSYSGVEGEVATAIEALRRPEPPVLDEIAESLADARLVVVAGCGPLAIAARRWRTELAENAKMIARSEEYPESGHNDLVSYQAKPERGVVALVLRAPAEGGRCSMIMEAVARIYADAGVKVHVLDLGVEGLLASMLRGAQLAGIASVKAAVLRGIDPLETPLLSRYRELQGKASKTAREGR